MVPIACWGIAQLIKVINEIVRMLDGDIKHLKELIGHTPVQVVSGALLGLLLTLLMV